MRETLIQNQSEWQACLEKLAMAQVIGFDTEFVSEETFRPELCLVQAAIEDELFVIDPYKLDGLAGFWHILASGEKTIVVHAGREEVRVCQHFSGHQPKKLFDIQVAGGLLGLGFPSSYGALVSQLTGTRLNKHETLTDWRIRPLRQEQIRYAFDDVRFLLPCWKKMKRELEELGRVEWATEEFDSFLSKVDIDDDETERWRKVRGAGNLDPRKLAMVREIYYWREELAEKRDRPPRAILRDDLIMEVVKRNPKAAADIAHIRGLQPRDIDPLFSCVEKARALPKEELPEVEDSRQEAPQVQVIAQVLGCILSDLCGQIKLAPSLAATASHLRALVRGMIAGTGVPTGNPLAIGWREKKLLPILTAFLEGKAALRIACVDREFPFEYDNLSPPG